LACRRCIRKASPVEGKERERKEEENKERPQGEVKW
jgi:hypothetical protein